MSDGIAAYLNPRDLPELKSFLARMATTPGRIVLRNDILLGFQTYCDEKGKSAQFMKRSSVAIFLNRIQEIVTGEEYLALVFRETRARSRFFRLSSDGQFMEEISAGDYLDLKDTLTSERPFGGPLRIDMMPFYSYAPSQKDPKNIGNGIRFLNRYMSSKFFQDPGEWNVNLFKFLKLHAHRDRQLLINGSVISDFDQLYATLPRTMDWLKTMNPDTPWKNLSDRLRRQGYEPGWGNTARRVLESMELLLDLINEPDDTLLEAFISRVPAPLISRIAIVSPHGWFGQEDVLGLPDTGGQVIYILDQVRALERHIKEETRLAGLEVEPKILILTRLIPESGETSCHLPREKVANTDHAWIVRIPFRSEDGTTLPSWISRFKVWPYLERFAEEAAPLLQSEFQGRPDLIIGNYSDGNLVATLLSDKLNVIQCTIAHALEKSKYLFSDLYWKTMEADYHFSLQFTADMLSMNKSDFIITSTYQEIAGTEDELGQYESYQHFSLPGLFQVINGINLFAPKFNVIPPGVDDAIYFPFYEMERRTSHVTESLRHWIFQSEEDRILGHLENPEKPPIFTLARFDRIKNITGLIDAFGQSSLLREEYNLVFSAGKLHPEESSDPEEKDQIIRAHDLIQHYNLHGSFRWLPTLKKAEAGEAYRIMADLRGIFVQPALFEAFGLTVLEAMASGLPTFATRFGGPSEIIQHGENGHLLNTSRSELMARSLEAFHRKQEKDHEFWDSLSKKGVARIRDQYTWNLYTEKLVRLAKLYGFWRYSVSEKGKIQMDRYCDLIYRFLLKSRVKTIT